MDSKQIDEGKIYFNRVTELLGRELKKKLLKEGTLEELMKPSIFDTDVTKALKQQLADVQEYIEEIQYIDQNKT